MCSFILGHPYVAFLGLIHPSVNGSHPGPSCGDFNPFPQLHVLPVFVDSQVSFRRNKKEEKTKSVYSFFLIHISCTVFVLYGNHGVSRKQRDGSWLHWTIQCCHRIRPAFESHTTKLRNVSCLHHHHAHTHSQRDCLNACCALQRGETGSGRPR